MKSLVYSVQITGKQTIIHPVFNPSAVTITCSSENPYYSRSSSNCYLCGKGYFIGSFFVIRTALAEVINSCFPILSESGRVTFFIWNSALVYICSVTVVQSCKSDWNHDSLRVSIDWLMVCDKPNPTLLNAPLIFCGSINSFRSCQSFP